MKAEEIKQAVYRLSNTYGMSPSHRADTIRLIESVIEACALLCVAIDVDKHAQYKGWPPHAPDNEHRGDPHTEGESDGAGLCADAIRAMKET